MGVLDGSTRLDKQKDTVLIKFEYHAHKTFCVLKVTFYQHSVLIIFWFLTVNIFFEMMKAVAQW